MTNNKEGEGNEKNYYKQDNNDINNRNNNSSYMSRNNKNEDKYSCYQIMITETMNKSYNVIFSDDLDGWNDEIEEYL